MEREIKFRGRSVHTDDWCYGSFVNNPDEPTICWFDIWADGDSDWREEKVEPHTVGQFTGLHDKNGKEIYDGDILAENGKQIGYIVGGVRGYCYDVIYNPVRSNGEKDWSLYGVVITDYPDSVEVIGNVYDNPELLKGDEK